MKLDKIAGSKNDEFYTPEYAIKPILKYIKPNSTIWCPFDKKESLYVKVLEDAGYTVIATHIDTGGNFFSMDVECDYIISNPPYSVKTDVLERLFLLGKPFAMLVGVAGLFESQRRFQMFKSNDFEVMYFNKRVSYFQSYEEQKPTLNPPFSSVYICKGMLPKKIIFEEIEKK